jgi:hypothetical protein
MLSFGGCGCAPSRVESPRLAVSLPSILCQWLGAGFVDSLATSAAAPSAQACFTSTALPLGWPSITCAQCTRPSGSPAPRACALPCWAHEMQQSGARRLYCGGGSARKRERRERHASFVYEFHALLCAPRRQAAAHPARNLALRSCAGALCVDTRQYAIRRCLCNAPRK